MVNCKELAFTFFITGAILTSIKYIISEFNDTVLAAILGGIPLGLLSIYLINPDKCLEYTNDYFIVTLIFLISFFTFYITLRYAKLHKNIVLTMALLLWIILVCLRYWYVTKYKLK
jgi:uncharacterized membrane protein YjjP (DUF1212 family)